MTPLLLMSVLVAGAQTASPDAAAETAEAAANEPGVEIVATTPTDVQFQAQANDPVIPLRPVHPAPPRSSVSSGMWIGAGIGVLAGALGGYAHDRDHPTPSQGECDPICDNHTSFGPIAAGLLGLAIGAAVGAIIDLF